MPGEVLALKPVNDTELLSISGTLNPGFGYVLVEAHCNISQDTADDWDGFGQLRISQPSTALDGFDYRMPIQFSNYSQDGVTKKIVATRGGGTYQLLHTPIVPPEGGSTFSMSFANLAAAAAAAGVVDAVVSFWQYDLAQLQYFPVHVATGTFLR